MAETYKVNGIILPDGNMVEFNPPIPTENDRGGVIAREKTEDYTVEAMLGKDGKIYVPQSQGGNAENAVLYISQLLNELQKEQARKNIGAISIDELNEKISSIPKFSIKVVDSLPEFGEENVVYLVRNVIGENNLYDEFIYVNGEPEYLGSQSVDLSGYALKTDIPVKLSQLTNDSEFITNTVKNLVNYYTKEDVYSRKEIDQKGYLTEHQDLSGYAKKASTLAGYGITDAATSEQFNQLSQEINDQLPPHRNTPRKPQTTIVNDCQDSTTYKGSGLTVNTTDNILGSQCVNVSGSGAYIRFTKNVFDVKNNHLVLKIKLNSLDVNTQIQVKMKHTTSETIYTQHIVTRYSTAENTIFGEWREYTIPLGSYTVNSFEVDALDFEAIDDVFVQIIDNSGGTGGGNFDIQFIGLRPNTQNKGIISFVFDDSWKSQYEGIKILAERGLTGTIYHIKDMDETLYLTTAEAKELVDYYGADIEVHNDVIYRNMTDAELVAHWKDYQKYLKENGLSDGRHMAYPGGGHQTRVVELARKYFDSCRTIEGFTQCESYPPYDNYRMRAVSGVTDSNVYKMKEYIDKCVEYKTWLILVFHKIETGTSGDAMYCSPEALAELADYAIASGARIMNIAEVFETNGGGSGVVINDVISALPVYNGEVE